MGVRITRGRRAQCSGEGVLQRQTLDAVIQRMALSIPARRSPSVLGRSARTTRSRLKLEEAESGESTYRHAHLAALRPLQQQHVISLSAESIIAAPQSLVCPCRCSLHTIALAQHHQAYIALRLTSAVRLHLSGSYSTRTALVLRTRGRKEGVRRLQALPGCPRCLHSPALTSVVRPRGTHDPFPHNTSPSFPPSLLHPFALADSYPPSHSWNPRNLENTRPGGLDCSRYHVEAVREADGHYQTLCQLPRHRRLFKTDGPVWRQTINRHSLPCVPISLGGTSYPLSPSCAGSWGSP